MSEDLTKKLLEYQVPHLMKLYNSLDKKNRAIDASDTGTGKTYTAIAVCKMLKCNPFIICPKSVVTNWVNVCKYFNCELVGIANYEMIKSCKYYNKSFKMEKCPYITKETVKKEKKVKIPKSRYETLENIKFIKSIDKNLLLETFQKLIDNEIKQKEDEIPDKFIPDYNLNFPENTIVILDEAHRCKNLGSLTNKLLLALNKTNTKILMLSATLSDKIECFKPFGIMLGFYKEQSCFADWVKYQATLRHIFNKEHINIKDDENKIKLIHKAIFPDFGARMKIKDLGDLFPKNNIISTCYYLQNHDEVNKQYKEINESINELKNKETKANVLVKILRARQKIEMLKIPLIIDLIEEAIDNNENNSIVIFLNYRETMEQIKNILNEDMKIKNISLIIGEQKIKERDKHIDKFQDNSNKIMLCMVQAGNVGISLHDLHGDNPRISLISPSWSGQDMKQVFGRIHRAGAKSPAIQKLLYVANTYEEKVCELLQNKIKNIDILNDGDFCDLKIEKEELEEINNFNVAAENINLDTNTNTNNDVKIKVPRFKKKDKINQKLDS